MGRTIVQRILDPLLAPYIASVWSRVAKSGASIDHDSALTLSAVMQAARAVSVDTSGMPTHLYRRLPGGGKERAADDPRYRMLHTQPNPRMSIVDFKVAQRMAQLFHGNSYALKEFDARGRCVRLWPLRPETVTFDVGDDGELHYYEWDGIETTNEFLPGEILHRRGLSRDGVTGLSVIKYATDSLGLAKTQQDEVSEFFHNGSRFGGFLKTDGTLSDTARKNIEKSLADNTRGTANAWKWRVIEEGLTPEEIGVKPAEAQLLESRKWSNIEVCQWFDVPPWRVHMLENGLSYASMEQQFSNYAVFNLRQWYYGDDMAWTTQLLSESEQEELFFETDPKALLMGDTAARYEAYTKALDGGWMCVNEVRAIENLNPIEGGDSYYRRLDAMGEVGAQKETAATREEAEVAGVLIRAGFNPQDSARAAGLPNMGYEPVQPVTVRPVDESGVQIAPAKAEESKPMMAPPAE